MLEEHSAGSIIFRIEKGEILFLLLHYEEGHWGAPKGHIEKGETLEQTALREIREETGLTDINFVPGFQAKNHYTYNKGGQFSNKCVVFFLSQTRNIDVRLSDEHLEYAWLPFAEAQLKVTFKSEKEVLSNANQHLLKMLKG